MVAPVRLGGSIEHESGAEKTLCPVGRARCMRTTLDQKDWINLTSCLDWLSLSLSICADSCM